MTPLSKKLMSNIKILKIKSPGNVIVKCKKCGYGPWSINSRSFNANRTYSICPWCKACEYRDRYHKNKKILAIKYKYGSLQVFWQCKLDGHKDCSAYNSFCSKNKVSCTKCFDRKCTQRENEDANVLQVDMYEMADSMIKPPSKEAKHDLVTNLVHYVKGYASNYLKHHHLSILASIKNIHNKPIFAPECVLINNYHDYKYYKNKIYIKVICRRCQTKFYALIHNLIHHKIVCPYCSQNVTKGEYATIKYLNLIGLPEFDGRSAENLNELNKHECGFKYRYIPKQLYGLHLDLIVKLGDQYYPIEYDGYQHHCPVDVFGGKLGYKNLHENDLRKDKLCKQIYGRQSIRIKDKKNLENPNDVWRLVSSTLNKKFLPIYLKHHKVNARSYNFINSNVEPSRPKQNIPVSKARKMKRTKEAQHLQRKLYYRLIYKPKSCVIKMKKHLGKLKTLDKKLYKTEMLALKYLTYRIQHVHGRLNNMITIDDYHHLGHLEAGRIFNWFKRHSDKEKEALYNKIHHIIRKDKYALVVSYLFYTSVLTGLSAKYNINDSKWKSYTASQVSIIFFSGIETSILRNDYVVGREYEIKYNDYAIL